jgi:hypothetical protein
MFVKILGFLKRPEILPTQYWQDADIFKYFSKNFKYGCEVENIHKRKFAMNFDFQVLSFIVVKKFFGETIKYIFVSTLLRLEAQNNGFCFVIFSVVGFSRHILLQTIPLCSSMTTGNYFITFVVLCCSDGKKESSCMVKEHF